MISPLTVLTQTDILGEVNIPDWFKEQYSHWYEIVSNKSFPCHFGTVAARKGQLRYFFIENNDFQPLPQALRQFLELSRGSKNRHAFVLFIKPEIPVRSFAYYEKYFWNVLHYLHEHDEKEWCEDIPIDPDDANWEFCFDGEPIFVSANMPAYTRRITRNIGNSLILIFQPRKIFNEISYNTTRGKKTIDLIRSRVEAIEKVPYHPDLGEYGNEAYREWKQYVITDDSEPRSGECPIRAKWHEEK